MGTGDFVFIQEKGTGSHKSGTKSLIKMHVMDRVVMQRRALKQEHSDDNSNRDTTEWQVTFFYPPNCFEKSLVVNIVLSDRAALLEHHTNHNNFRCITGIDDMLRLSGHSIEVNTQTKFLLHHYLNYRPRTLCTITAETGWLKYAIKDNGLFNITLYQWASMFNSALPPKYQFAQHLLRLKAAAIRTLALNLQPPSNRANSDVEMVSDAMIATVSCLANLLCGDLEEAEIHFQGLKALIKGRKGVLPLGYEGLAGRILLNKELSFDETSLSSEPVRPQLSLPDSQRSHLQPHTLTIVHELRLIAKELITTPAENMSQENRVKLGFRLVASDRSILKYVHDANGSSVLALVARAALLYSHAVLRGALRSSHFLITLVNQLKQSIISAFGSKGDIFASHPAALVLLVGVIASGRENIQGTWFRLCLEKACGSDSRLPWEKVQQAINAPTNKSPAPFYWMIEEISLLLPCINSAILC
ncbi:LOW QUALITY PROTEIN: hypothetical protein N5P37_011784 [Trichoderma harzianum]|nr:LOW QUALITY PROTEIN: hypothetical protein N5P37_011784 [Trichoderma harzianum]